MTVWNYTASASVRGDRGIATDRRFLSLGGKRPKRLANMDGFDAIILWDEYCRGDQHALERLIDYNRADVIGLRSMMEQCYNRMAEQHARFFQKSRRPFASVT